MGFRLTYLRFTWARAKDQVKVTHVSIANISLMMTDRANNYYYCHHIETHVSAFNWHMYILICAHFKDQDQSHVYFYCKYIS